MNEKWNGQKKQASGVGTVFTLVVIGVVLMNTMPFVGVLLIVFGIVGGLAFWAKSTAEKSRPTRGGKPQYPRYSVPPTEYGQTTLPVQHYAVNNPVQSRGLGQRAKYAAYRPVGGFTTFKNDEEFWKLRDDEALWNQPAEKMPWELPPEQALW